MGLLGRAVAIAASAALGLHACSSEPAAVRGEGASCDATQRCASALLCVDGECVARPAPPAPPPEDIVAAHWLDIVTPDAPDVDEPDAADTDPDGVDGVDGVDVVEVATETRLVLGVHDALLDPSDTRLGLAIGQAAVRQVDVPAAAEVLGVEVVLRAPDGAASACGRYMIVVWSPDEVGAFPVAPTWRSEVMYGVVQADPVRLELPERWPVAQGALRFGLMYDGACEASVPPWIALDASGPASDTWVWANTWIPGQGLGLDGRWGLALAVAVQVR